MVGPALCGQSKKKMLSAETSSQLFSTSPAKAPRSRQPQGRSPRQDIVIADSEEPLILHRQHGPAKRAFLDAHALPCSSPNSPPDPLCSYVPATADGSSPAKGAHKKPLSPQLRSGKLGGDGDGERRGLEADDEVLDGAAAEHGKQKQHAAR